MKYPKNDLWSVRQIEFLKDALEGYENKMVDYYPAKKVTIDIPGIENYEYQGVLCFPGDDRTIILEQGKDYGLSESVVLAYLESKNIKVEIH